MKPTRETVEQPVEQLLYARLLDWSTRIGLVVLVLSFASYMGGLTSPRVPLEQLPTLWGQPVGSYLRATGGFDPDRLDIIGGPWQDRKDYAGFAVMLHERMKRNGSPEVQKRYRQAVLDEWCAPHTLAAIAAYVERPLGKRSP